jgi:16S rRNA (uracil1498-N3)-methyltransferase
MVKNRIRLFLEHDLRDGSSVVLSKKEAHYLFNVMRLEIGDELTVFNNFDGEWLSKIQGKNRGSGVLSCIKKVKGTYFPADIWLLFSPIKKTGTDFIVEKATEMGISKIFPVLTDHSNTNRISKDRLRAHAIEAAEQCGTNYVPEVLDLRTLEDVLNSWPDKRKILFCDESLNNFQGLNRDKSSDPWAILVGPEGGFSAKERKRILSEKFVWPISLGPRILRADTAAIVALTLWQSSIGDW